MKKDNAKLTASTLAEAEKHRDTFRDLVRDNEGLRGDLKALEQKLTEAERTSKATAEQQANTKTDQERLAADLAEREEAHQKATTALETERMAFTDENTAATKKAKERDQLLDDRERDLTAKETAFEKMTRDTAAAHTAKEAEIKDREDRLAAGEARLKADSQAFQEERASYKDTVREEISEELLAKFK